MGINSGRIKDKIGFVAVTSQIQYAFKTFDIASVSGITAADLTAIGHSYAVPQTGIIALAINAPKPPRGSKKVTGIAGRGSVNTFVAYDKIAAANAAGWAVSMKSARDIGNIGSTPLTTIAIATLSAASGGALYSFPMRTADFSARSQALGLTAASTTANSASERVKVIEGASYPRPGKAKISEATIGVGASAGRMQSFSSFYSTASAGTLQTTGWFVSPEIPYPRPAA